MTRDKRGMLLAMVFIAVWTLVELVAAGVLARVSPFQVVWTRYVVHLLLMLLLFWRRPSTLWRTSRPVYQLLRSLLMVGMPASWIFAMQAGVDGGLLMAIFWISPLLVLVLARLLLGEVAPAGIWIAAAIGWSGAFLVLGHVAMPASPMSLVLPLAMALSFSLYVVMTRALRDEGTPANLFYSAGGVVLFLTPFMPVVWATPAASDLVVMTAVGVLGFLSLLALDRMAAVAAVSRTAPVLYLQVPATIVLLTAAGAGGVTWRMAGGLLLIAFAAWLAWSREHRVIDQAGRAGAPAVSNRTSVGSLHTP